MARELICLLISILSFLIYLYGLTQVASRKLSIFLNSPWYIFGILSQVFILACHVMRSREKPLEHDAKSLNKFGGAPSQILAQTSLIMLWLQMSIAYSLIVTSIWISTHQQPKHLYFLWVFLALLPLGFYLLKWPLLTERVTQVGVIINSAALMYNSTQARNFSGMQVATLMMAHLILASLPRSWPLIQECNILLPSLMSLLIPRSLGDSDRWKWILDRREQAQRAGIINDIVSRFNYVEEF